MSGANAIMTVTTSTLVKTFKSLLKDPYLVPCVMGPAGIGKSSISNQIAELDFDSNLLDIRLGQVQEEDLIGIPGIKDGRTIYNLPFFWPTAGKGIIFFDEVNRAKKGMLQCLFQLALDRKYFNYELPRDYRLVFAGNWSPEEATYQVEELDPALRSRFCMLYYTGPTYAEWKEWAVKSDIAPEIMGFLGAHNNLLVTEPKDEKPSPNPRTWEKSSRVLKVTHDREVRKAALSGYIGMEATAMLLSYIETGYEALPDPSDLKAAVQFIRKWLKTKKNDTLTSFIESISDYVKGGGEYVPGEFGRFVRELPKEFSFSLLKSLHEHPETSEFAKEVLENDEELLRDFLKAA